VPDPVIVGSVIAPLTAAPDGKVTDAGAGFAENVVLLVLWGGGVGVGVLCGVAVGPLGIVGVPPPPPPPPHATREQAATKTAKARADTRGKENGTTPSQKRAGAAFFS
jgi:hypothetical protein